MSITHYYKIVARIEFTIAADTKNDAGASALDYLNELIPVGLTCDILTVGYDKEKTDAGAM